MLARRGSRTALAGALLLIAGCSGPTGSDGPRPAVPATSPSAQGLPTGPPQDKTSRTREPIVILISVDGLNPDAITQLDARGKVPNFRLLLAEGAATLNARTAYEQTNTLPNHTGMLTGRPVSGRTGTQVTFNSPHPGTLASVSGNYIPGVFDPIHDAGLSTLFLAQKAKFAFLVRSWDALNGAVDTTGADDGRDKIDTFRISADPDRLTTNLASRLRAAPPRFTFLHIAGPDAAGHGDPVEGFMGADYLEAVAEADAQLGVILQAVRSNPKIRNRTTIVLTADHGGRGLNSPPGFGHRAPQVLDNYRIPFIVWGPQAAAGVDLYEANKGNRRDPDLTRVDYTGPQPIRNLDAANLVLSIFDLPPLPGTRPGRGLRLS